jgi:hypothetical protein
MVGVFEDEYHAKKAIDDLKSMGFRDDQVGIAVREGGFTATCILDNLVNLGVPEEEVNYYRREFEADHVIVAVKYNCSKEELIDFLLSNCGPEQFSMSVTGLSVSSTLDVFDSQEDSSPDSDELTSLRRLLEKANLDHLL